MPRLQSIKLAALNLKIHPHRPEQYIELIRDAFALRQPVKSQGDHRLIMQSFSRKDDSINNFHFGSIARFTEIDLNAPWFNSDDLEEAENVTEEIKIPEELKPNYYQFHFALYPKKHLIIFENYYYGKVLTPNTAQKYFDFLLAHQKIEKKYGKVDVDLVADTNAIEQIFSLHTIKNVHMKINKPNADDFGEYDEHLFKRMKEQNTRRVELDYVAEKGVSFRPDKITLETAKVAANNGEVIAVGRDVEGKSETRSSTSFPRMLVHKFDPALITITEAFKKAVHSFVG